MAMSSLLVARSRHTNGRFQGTAGGAEPPLTPTDSILTPRIQSSLVITGSAARVRPGTSLCGQHVVRSQMLAAPRNMTLTCDF